MAADTVTKKCTKCLEEKPLTEFFSRGGKLSHLYKSRCKLCMQSARQVWAENNKKYLNAWRRNNWEVSGRRFRRRGTTKEVYDQLYECQQGTCALCGEVDEKLVWLCIDHDHLTGKVRGLLCPNCNRGLGLLKDDADLLRRAADYVEFHRPALPDEDLE